MAERHGAGRGRGLRLTEAMPTAALSMIRLMIIAATSFSTATLSAATPAIFQASWSSRLSRDLDGWSLTGWSCMAVFPWGEACFVAPGGAFVHSD